MSAPLLRIDRQPLFPSLSNSATVPFRALTKTFQSGPPTMSVTASDRRLFCSSVPSSG